MRLLGLISVIAALLVAPNVGAQAIVQIASYPAAGSLFVKSDGSLWRGDLGKVMKKRFAERQSGFGDLLQKGVSQQEVQDQMRLQMDRLMSSNDEPAEIIVSNVVTTVAMNGQKSAFFIRDNGSLWAMGNNSAGFLGDGTYDTAEHPIQIVSGGVVAVACGAAFTVFLKDDGSVWSFGYGLHGFGGGGSDASELLPKQFVAGGVKAIATGSDHILVLKHDGSLWGTGYNGCGELGLGTNVEHALHYVEIVASNVVSVAAANHHSLFIKSDGSLWDMGMNDRGQLGDCTIDWRHRPQQVVASNVVAVAAGYMGSVFLKKDGSLWGMGINWASDYGEGVVFNSRCPKEIFGANNSALVAGYYYNTQFKTCTSLWAGQFNNNPAQLVSANGKGRASSSVQGLPGYNLITIEQLKDGNVRLTYSGNAGVNYALDRSSSMAKPQWLPLVTNTAPSGGVLVITNTPDTSMNNFWRIRSVP